jgi:hypothetical protein
VSATIEALPVYKKQFDYLVLTVWDYPNETLITHFDLTSAYIHQAITNGGKVLIHCMAGASRSVTIAIAYFMREHNMTLEKAVTLLREKRPSTNPNAGFLEQLRIYERRLQEIPPSDIRNENEREWWQFLWLATPIQRCYKTTGTCRYLHGSWFSYLTQQLALYPLIIQNEQIMSRIIQFVRRNPTEFTKRLWTGL